MEKLIKLNSELLKARKSKDKLTSNLLSCLKGLYELDIKKSMTEGDVTIEAIAKKMIKSAEQVGTKDAKAEIVILKGYIPEMLSDEATKDLVSRVMGENSKLVELKNHGALMGVVMKTGEKVNPQIVKAFINDKLV